MCKLPNTEQEHYDAIIIGSGMGGLTCASLLSRMENKKVLVLERHFTPGGYTHTFKRKGIYQWDVGVHYVGEMNPGSFYRRIFDYVTDEQVEWQKMPKVYDRFVYPDITFDAQNDREGFIQDLIDKFPNEKQSIQEYRKDLIKAARWFGRLMLSKITPETFQPVMRQLLKFGSKIALTTTKDYLDGRFKDSRLRALVASQWGDIGIPPGSSAFAAHALIVCHYIGGGYYPVGGASVIADSIVPILERSGGKLLTRHRVNKIIVRDNKAIGVETAYRYRGKDAFKQFSADTIISNAGVNTTFNQLISDDFELPFRSQLNRYPPGSAHVCLYIGLKDNPAKLGFNGENLWIYDGYDHDKIYAERGRVVEGEISGCFLSFPSLKDRKAIAHTAELISFADYQQFHPWFDRSWKKRGSEYENTKHRITKALIAFVDKRYPGFAGLIDYCELSTPLTTEDFTGHHQGCIYGLPAIPEKLRASWLTPKTPIENLYLTGSDVAGHGIVGALMGGVMTTLAISENKLSLLKMIASAKNPFAFS